MHQFEFTPVFDAEKDRLEQIVSRRLGNRIRHLRLVFQGPGVVLRGRSETYHSKQLAQHAVMELSDRPILANEIQVK